MGDQKFSNSKLGLKLKKLAPYLSMISMQFGFAGMYIITMVSLKRGMNHYILAVYRHAIATVVIAPFAFVLERKIRPKMTLPIFLKIMVLGFLEPVLDQNLYYIGMTYTSATYASATANVLPAITFIMAIIFRLESVNIKKKHSQAKILGTVITVSGALIMTLYKGPIIDFFGGSTRHATNSDAGDKHWIAGTLMLIARSFGWSGFFILQTFTLKEYPAELSLTTLICLMGTLEGGLVSLIMERDMSSWRIGWDSNLLAAAYSGVICSGIAYYVQGVVMRERGPVFVASFNPLCVIITAALGAIILSEKIHLGSVIGTVLIVTGLYAVVWGKSKDKKVGENLSIDNEKNVELELPISNPDNIKVGVEGAQETKGFSDIEATLKI